MPDNTGSLGGSCISFGAGIGGLTGLSLGIWACVKYLEPGLDQD